MNNYAVETRRRSRSLLIVEGKHEKDELFWLIFKCFPELNIDINDVWIYGTNIYKLYEDIVKEYGKYAIGVDDAPMISAVVPGVMGQTGMESAEIVRGIVSETNPDVIIAVDALAARNSKRLNRTIQIADTGIHPGSGVGNHRNGMTMETLGVPVIGIGVPTVVDAATIVNDTMENFIRALESSDSLKGVGEVLRSYNAGEKYEFVKELISPHLNGMFVTPKDVDEMVHHISHTLSEAINMLFSAGSGRSEA